MKQRFEESRITLRVEYLERPEPLAQRRLMSGIEANLQPCPDEERVQGMKTPGSLRDFA
jgi:hypothetical protein